MHSTGSTAAGAQHAAYDMQLAGTGDFVLTDLRTAESELRVLGGLAGRLFVWDGRGGLVAEVATTPERALALAVPSGSYVLSLSDGAHRRVAKVQVRAGQPVQVSPADFSEQPVEKTRLRGTGAHDVPFVPFAAALIPPYSTLSRAAHTPMGTHFDLALLYDDPDVLEGLALSLGGTRARAHARGLQLGLAFTDAERLSGLSIAGFANVARSLGQGAQVSGLIAIAGLDLVGLQAASVTFARELEGGSAGPRHEPGGPARARSAARLHQLRPSHAGRSARGG
ncbi:MAG: hypothetical protein QM778_05855 [Myxococcales bacterium]